jgi:hypothetical protein
MRVTLSFRDPKDFTVLQRLLTHLVNAVRLLRREGLNPILKVEKDDEH